MLLLLEDSVDGLLDADCSWKFEDEDIEASSDTRGDTRLI